MSKLWNWFWGQAVDPMATAPQAESKQLDTIAALVAEDKREAGGGPGASHELVFQELDINSEPVNFTFRDITAEWAQCRVPDGSVTHFLVFAGVPLTIFKATFTPRELDLSPNMCLPDALYQTTKFAPSEALRQEYPGGGGGGSGGGSSGQAAAPSPAAPRSLVRIVDQSVPPARERDVAVWHVIRPSDPLRGELLRVLVRDNREPWRYQKLELARAQARIGAMVQLFTTLDPRNYQMLQYALVQSEVTSTSHDVTVENLQGGVAVDEAHVARLYAERANAGLPPSRRAS